jgi:hypothetical protein
MEDTFEVITAFVDGERVDPQALKDALSDSEGREYLIDIVALREAVSDRAVVAPALADSQRPLRYWLAAAAVVLLSAASGYAVGARGVGEAATPSSTVVGRQPIEAPTPSRVIRFEQGVNWTETPAPKSSGGGQ